MNSASKFLNPAVVVVGVGHISVPLSFIGSVCGWFSGLSIPSYLVLVAQEVYLSGSVKRSLSLDRCCTHRVYSVFCFSVSELSSMSIRHLFFWFRNISSILVWGIVGEHGLENMTVGSNNIRFVLAISHLFSSLICSLSYPQHLSGSVKYLAPMS